jgi:hypothetical protein
MQPVEKPADKRTVNDLAGDVMGHRTLHLSIFPDDTCLNALDGKKRGQSFSDVANTTSVYITGPIVDVQFFPDDPEHLAVFVLHNDSPDAVKTDTGLQVASVLPPGTIQADTINQLGRYGLHLGYVY